MQTLREPQANVLDKTEREPPALQTVLRTGTGEALPEERVVIVCLCGSTRFKKEFENVNRTESLAGHIVLAPGFYGHVDGEPTPEQKAAVDELHLRKVELADLVIVVSDASEYYGESTRRELEHARRLGKPIEYRAVTLPLADDLLEIFDPELLAGSFKERKEK